TTRYARRAAATLASATRPANFSPIAAATDPIDTTPDSAANPPSSTAFGSGLPRYSLARSVAGPVRLRRGGFPGGAPAVCDPAPALPALPNRPFPNAAVPAPTGARPGCAHLGQAQLGQRVPGVDQQVAAGP